MYNLKISSKWFKTKCSFVSKSQNSKIALCSDGTLVAELTKGVKKAGISKEVVKIAA